MLSACLASVSARAQGPVRQAAGKTRADVPEQRGSGAPVKDTPRLRVIVDIRTTARVPRDDVDPPGKFPAILADQPERSPLDGDDPDG